MNDQLIPYEVVDGERWDNVAYKAYGDPGMTDPIIAANPSVPITMRLIGGTVLYIPILDSGNSVVASIEQTPPWRR